MRPVKREAYSGPVSTGFVHSATAAATVMDGVDSPTDKQAIRARGPTRGGGRDMQESSFALSGEWASILLVGA